jgi:LysR family transcriptional regulator, hydrogen peroxide-inducible genes activator
MQIRELELRLDCQLFERTRSRVLITPAGEEIVRRARAVLTGIADIKDAVKQRNLSGLEGLLRIGTVPTVGAYVLSLVLPDIQAAYPGLKLSIFEEPVEALPDKLAAGHFDILLIPEPMQDDEFEERLVLRERMHVVLPSDHKLAQQPTISAEQLSGETIMLIRNKSKVRRDLKKLCTDVGANYTTDYNGQTLDTLRLMVTCGMGLTLLPALYIRSDVLREKLVVARPLSSMAPSRDIYLAWRKSSPQKTAYSGLSDLVQERLAPWDDQGSI